MEKITDYLIKPTVKRKGIVKAWEEVIMLPTYEIGEEEKNPIFLEKRVYQGSSGSVYPYPVVEKITDEKVDKPYKALFLENYYLKIKVRRGLLLLFHKMRVITKKQLNKTRHGNK